MAELKKYIMKDNNDYRPAMDNHRVVMVKRIGSVEWAYGKFTQVDEDMLDLTELEVTEIASLTSDISIPSISLRQAKELLIETDRYQDVLDIIAGIEDPKQKMLVTISNKYFFNLFFTYFFYPKKFIFIDEKN